MKRYARSTILLVPMFLSLLISAGCQRDFYAKHIVTQDTGRGKLALMLTGTAEQLLAKKRIDLHRQVETPDKAVIDVWVIRAAQANPSPSQPCQPKGTVLLLHDLGDSKASHLSLGRRLASMGYDVVLPDLRAHGRSTGKYITYGALEKRDVLAVVDALLEEQAIHEPLYAFGVSLGGATAIQYAAGDPRCKGVMALAPYKDARSITRRRIAFIAPMMSGQDFEEALRRAGDLANFDPAQASALEAAGKLKCPLLLVHGLLDEEVPVSHSQEIYEVAHEPKQLVIIPWAMHATLLMGMEAWIADQIDLIARTGLTEQASPPPAP